MGLELTGSDANQCEDTPRFSFVRDQKPARRQMPGLTALPGAFLQWEVRHSERLPLSKQGLGISPAVELLQPRHLTGI